MVAIDTYSSLMIRLQPKANFFYRFLQSKLKLTNKSNIIFFYDRHWTLPLDLIYERFKGNNIHLATFQLLILKNISLQLFLQYQPFTSFLERNTIKTKQTKYFSKPILSSKTVQKHLLSRNYAHKCPLVPAFIEY